MKNKIKLYFSLFLFILCIGVANASNFTYNYNNTTYKASLEGGGVINSNLSFTLTGGYLIPENPNLTYTVYANITAFNTQGWESPGGGSISTIYDTNPVILTGNASVFKTWYQAAISPQSMGYAESTDGITWYKYASNPVLSGYFGGDVVKYNGTYFMFANQNGNVASIYRLNSTDGITWNVDTAVASKGSGSWSSSGLIYNDVWMDSTGNWKMLISGTDASNHWGAGLWTATVPNGTWTVYEGNPVIRNTSVGNGSGLVYLPSGTYKDPLGYTWTWLSASQDATGAAQYTDSMRYRTVNPNDLTSWTPNPITYLNVGPVRYTGYPGDWQGRTPQNYIRVRNTTYEFYTYNIAGKPGFNGLLTTSLRMDQIVATDEMYPNLTSQQL